ncbi:hypothetical protein BDFB_008912, partial [Asbolus verrucosus]
ICCTLNLLPEKSRNLYKNEYQSFTAWCKFTLRPSFFIVDFFFNTEMKNASFEWWESTNSLKFPVSLLHIWERLIQKVTHSSRRSSISLLVGSEADML